MHEFKQTNRTLFLFLALLSLVFCTCLSSCGGGEGEVASILTNEDPQIISTDGSGDVNNIFPFTVGNTWGYHVITYETGQQAVDYTEAIKVSGTKLVGTNTAFVLTSLNVDNPGESGEEYFLKNNAAIYYLGDNSPTTSFPITPYPVIKFPVLQDGSFVQVNKAGIDYGKDLDGDGHNDSLAIYSKVTVAGYESVTVDAGTFENCARLVTSITETLTASRDQRQAVVNATISEWYAPGLGLVKRHAEYGYADWSKVTDYSLAFYAVEGRKSDTTSPTILSVRPNAGATLGAVSSVQAVFSEDIDSTSINATTFVLTDADNRPIPGAVSYIDKTATFTPAEPLTAGIYTATLTTSIQDKMANPLAANYSWSFTQDNTAPYIVVTSPPNGAVNIPISTAISATLNEALAGYSIDYHSFTVKDNNNNEVFGRVSYSNNVATVTPYIDLAWDTTYTATITTAVTDTAGNSLANSYSWSFSTPRGQFLSPINLTTDSTPQAVAIGDVNGDGLNDVAVVTSLYNNHTARDGKVQVFLQNVAGGLDPPIIYATSGTFANSPQTVAIGDVNHDGRNDVVAGNSGKDIEVFLQNAAGRLDPGVTHPTSDSDKVRIADLNNDGFQDVVGIGPGNNSVSIWFQNGNGILKAPVSYYVTHTGWDDLEVGDVNNDGLKDIVVMSGKSPSGVSVLTQSPDGAFNPAVGYPAISPWGIAVGDLNGDNKKDLVVTTVGEQYGSQISMFLQNAQGTFSLPNLYDSYNASSAIEIADINYDGRNDIIVLHNGYSTIGVYQQSADGTFQSEERYRAPSQNFNPQALAAGDINGDGLTDIAVGDSNGMLTILYHKPALSLGNAIARKAAATKKSAIPAFKGVSLRKF